MEKLKLFETIILLQMITYHVCAEYKSYENNVSIGIQGSGEITKNGKFMYENNGEEGEKTSEITIIRNGQKIEKKPVLVSNGIGVIVTFLRKKLFVQLDGQIYIKSNEFTFEHETVKTNVKINIGKKLNFGAGIGIVCNLTQNSYLILKAIAGLDQYVMNSKSLSVDKKVKLQNSLDNVKKWSKYYGGGGGWYKKINNHCTIGLGLILKKSKRIKVQDLKVTQEGKTMFSLDKPYRLDNITWINNEYAPGINTSVSIKIMYNF